MFKIDPSIDSQILERVETIGDIVGVIYDSSTSLDYQVKTVIEKCLKILGFIRKMTVDFRNVSTLAYLLYETLLLPILTYSSSI